MKAEEFKKHLTNDLIPFWNRLKDEENGGFYGWADGSGKADPKADKGVILHSRILWFYSAAYMLLQDEQLLSMADHAYRFLTEHCMDKRFGGVYWSLHYDGSPADEEKHTYNQAFAVYALSAYYRASGKREALEHAYELFELIEDKCSDENGYLEAFGREFTPAPNNKLSENGVMATRTMNTLLHVMEAYTELYAADHADVVGDALRSILGRFKEKIYNRDKERCEVFFDESYRSLIDLESYGHDIEAAWLIDRACAVLGDAVCGEEMRDIIDDLARGAYQRAMDPDTHAMNNECENGKVDTKKVWWVQAEAVTGFYNAYQRQPDQEEYRKCAEQVWTYIRNYVIDPETGEWIENIENNQIDRAQALVHPWKCPYHNGRMCIEMVHRLAAD